MTPRWFTWWRATIANIQVALMAVNAAAEAIAQVREYASRHGDDAESVAMLDATADARDASTGSALVDESRQRAIALGGVEV